MSSIRAGAVLASLCGLVTACTLTTPLDELGSGGSATGSSTAGPGASSGGIGGSGTGGSGGDVAVDDIGLGATSASHHRIDLEWQPQEDGGTFDVEQNGEIIRTGLSGTSFESRGLEPSTEYVFRVRHQGARGSVWSLPASAMTGREPRGSYEEQVLADEPRAYWRMEETTGAVMSDSTENVPAGLIEGGANPDVAGQLGSGTSFDGTDDHVTLGTVHTAESDWGWSWELWAHVLAVHSVGESGLMGCYNAPRLTVLSTGQITGGVVNRSGPTFNPFSTDVELPFGSWHHLVVTVRDSLGDKPVSKVYLDGALISMKEFTEAVHSPWSRGNGGATSDGDLHLNRRDTVNGVEGTYDEAAAYDYVLSGAQIERHYQEGAAGR